MGVHIRVPLRRGVVRDTMEDVAARPNTCVILENAKACITTSRMAMTEGVSSYHHVHVFVDTIILYFLSLIHRDTQTTFSNQVCPFKCQKFVKEMCPTLLGNCRRCL